MGIPLKLVLIVMRHVKVQDEFKVKLGQVGQNGHAQHVQHRAVDMGSCTRFIRGRVVHAAWFKEKDAALLVQCSGSCREQQRRMLLLITRRGTTTIHGSEMMQQGQIENDNRGASGGVHQVQLLLLLQQGRARGF